MAAVPDGGRQCHRIEGFRDAAAGASHVGTQPQIIYVDAPDVPGFGPMGEIQPR